MSIGRNRTPLRCASCASCRLAKWEKFHPSNLEHSAHRKDVTERSDYK